MTQIAQLLTDEDDEQLRLDTLEGETDLFELVSVLTDRIETLDGYRRALAEQINQRMLKIERLKLATQSIKDTIQSLMESAGVKKIPLPQATVFTSQRKGGWKVVVEPDQLDPAYRVEKTVYSANKVTINEAVEQGLIPQGVLRTNGGTILNIRRK